MARCAVLVVVGALALATAARAGDYEELGRLEREPVDATLAERGLRPEPAPAGKVVGRVIVVNRDVFGPGEGPLTLLNIFHRTTREYVIAREVLVMPGQLWNQELVDESRRRLSDRDLSSVVVLVPVVSAVPGQVDLLVVTRDIWSLRLNTNFEYQDGALLFFSSSLSENNLFGWRKTVAAVFNLDQGQYSVGPSYQDPNIRGTRLTFSGSARAIFGRDTREFEATSVGAAVAYPLWSLASRWGGSVSASHFDGTVRLHGQGAPLTFPLMPMQDQARVPVVYQSRSANLTTQAVRSFGRAIKQDLRAGHQLWSRQRRFTDDFPADPGLREGFARTFFGRNETGSGLYLGYTLYTPRYAALRELDNFDFREDRRLGPTVDLSVLQALQALGSDATFQSYGASGSWTADLLRGLQSVSVSWGGRYQGGRMVDQSVGAGVYLASPKFGRLLRVVGSAGASSQLEVVALGPTFLGGGDGLRGYQVSEFSGRAQVLTHLELRSMPLSVLFTRTGGVLFWDSGHAAARFGALRPRHDVGAGIRFLIPQTGAYVLRFDWAVPLQDGVRTAAGLPGRYSLGFHQVF